MRLLKPVLSLSVLFSFSYAMNCSLVKNVKKWGDHYYTITTNRLTWQQAVDFARESGGYLAIPNSAAENEFLKSLIPTPKYAWIGIYDPNYMTNYCYDDTHCAFDDSRFETIKGNPLTYKNWATNQPDNLVKSYDIVNGKQMVSPLGEHWVAMSSLNGKWADFGNHADEYNNPVKFYALIEFDKMPDCYTPPSDVNDTFTGVKCNTQIYDDKTGNLENGQTYNCLQDPNGNYYCPAALAPCGESWDYENGYSVAHTATYTATTAPICNNEEIKQNGRCYLDKNNDGKIDTRDKYPVRVDRWQYIQKQNGKFYRATEKYLNYPIKMRISWSGDDYHFGAKIKFRGRLVWSRIVVPVRKYCYGDDYSVIPDGDIKNVIWDVFPSCYQGSTAIGHGNFTYNASKMTARTNWNSERNLANVTGDYFFIFFRDGGHAVSNDWIKVEFLTTNTTPPFDEAEPVNPVWCPGGYTDDGTHLCYKMPSSCPDGYTQNGDTCEKTIDYTYYEYLCSGTNEYGEPYEPIDSGGDCNPTSESNLIDTNGDGVPDSCNSQTPPPNNCKAKSFVCKPAPDRKCVYVDNKWQCSPFPCIGSSDIEVDDTPTGIDDANNNGWNSNGSCSGTIYIFNGKDFRCRSDDAFGGLTGGGCCDKDKVLFGLISCEEEEKILAKKNNEGMCHYVGKYCSKKLKLLGGSVCIQHKKTYCCFNSKLARIINEQGRPQLGKNWGDAKHPNCRGFTPEEFQKLDFSKMDLSEFYNSISQNISQSVLNSMTQYIQNSLQNQLNNVSP